MAGAGGDICTLLIYRRPLPGVELAVAANRDELYARPRGEFGTIQREPLVLGGMDPEGGGTWLAVHEAGFVVAVTNARLGARRKAGDRSRGLLVLDLVRRASFGEAAGGLAAEDLRRYAPVNVVVASGAGLVAGTNLPEPRVERLGETALAAGNVPLFSGEERIAALLELGRPPEDLTGPEEYAAHLGAILARHEPPSACHHLERGGTVSSTVLLLARPFAGSVILHATGPPCRTPWRRVPARPIAPPGLTPRSG